MLKNAMRLAVLGMSFLGLTVGHERLAHANLRSTYTTYSFENGTTPTSSPGWWQSGNAGYTHYAGAGAYDGVWDMWINNWNPADWNSANTEFYANLGTATQGYCDVDWWQQTSATFNNASISFYEDLGGGNLAPIASQSLSANSGWGHFGIHLPGSTNLNHAIAYAKPILMTFGFWGQGAPGQWIGLDKIHVECWVQ